MYVCVCNAVTERQIHHAVKNGAKTIKQLKDTLGVASECGKCVACARACLKQAQNEQSTTLVQKHIQITPAPMSA